MFKFSGEYRDNTVVIAMFSIIACSVILLTNVIAQSQNEQFVTSVDQINQPNCVVGAYIMFAKESLDKELLVGDIKQKYPTFNYSSVPISCIIPYWDDMFPTNRLKCVYNDTKSITYHLPIVWGKPYIWTGRWYDAGDYHTCLVYFHPDYVIFKHFVYNPKTHYNYEVKTNYDFFFSRTIRLYQLK